MIAMNELMRVNMLAPNHTLIIHYASKIYGFYMALYAGLIWILLIIE